MGIAIVIVVVLAFQTVIRWQAVSRGLTDRSTDHVDHPLGSRLRLRKALLVRNLRSGVCFKLSFRSE